MKFLILTPLETRVEAFHPLDFFKLRLQSFLDFEHEKHFPQQFLKHSEISQLDLVFGAYPPVNFSLVTFTNTQDKVFAKLMEIAQSQGVTSNSELIESQRIVQN